MRALLAHLAGGRLPAIMASAVVAVLSLRLLPLMYLSGAFVGLATLRRGMREGAVVLGGAALLAGVLLTMVVGSAAPLLVVACLTWVPVWLMAAMLRATASQGLALTAAGVMGVVGILGIYLVTGDPAARWREALGVLEGMLRRADTAGYDAALTRLFEALAALAPFMTGLMVAGIVFGLGVTLFVARWWHAILDNPGGFAREFRALRFDRKVAVAVLAVGLGALLTDSWIGRVSLDVFWTGAVLFLFQGLALVHGVVAVRGASSGWLWGLYGMMIAIPPQAIMLVSAAGFVDTWFQLRERLTPPQGKG